MKNPTPPTKPDTAPCQCAGAKPHHISRRQFFARFSIVTSTLVSALIGLPVIGFIFGPILARGKQEWRNVGALDSFPVGTTTKVEYEDPSPLKWAGVTAKTAAYVHRKSQGEFIAYSVNCTHLGCPVRWLPDANLFMCPCHGGVYYANGDVAAGPPPKPLPRYPVRVVSNQVQIRTSPVPITSIHS